MSADNDSAKPDQSIRSIGVVGGGQLAEMFCEANDNPDLSIVVLDPTPDCPAQQAGAEQINGSVHSEDAVRELSKRVDILTVEIEDVSVELLAQVADTGKPRRAVRTRTGFGAGLHCCGR